MDLAQLVAYESGSVEVVEFSWPPAAEDQQPAQCVSYVIMKRPSGFLLCIPEGFLTQEELDLGQQPAEDSGIGPSLGVQVPPILLSPDGTWVAAPDQEKVAAVVVDMADFMADQLGTVDLTSPDLVPFRAGQPMIFPLAAEVLRFSREWLARAGALWDDRSGYHTAVSAAAVPNDATHDLCGGAAGPTAESFSKVAFASACGSPGTCSYSSGSCPECFATADLIDHSCAGPGPKGACPSPWSSSTYPGISSPTRFGRAGGCRYGGRRVAGPSDGEFTSLGCFGLPPVCGVERLPPRGPRSGDINQGSVNRARFQQELASRTGAFAQKIRDNMARRMDPTQML